MSHENAGMWPEAVVSPREPAVPGEHNARCMSTARRTHKVLAQSTVVVAPGKGSTLQVAQGMQ